MKAQRTADYVALMLDAAVHACTYVDGYTLPDFLADEKTQDAVILKLLVIGELASQILVVHPDFTEATPNVPWQQMKGMRNRLAHGYFAVDLNVVWATVQSALPELIRALEPGLDKSPKD